MFLQLRKGFNKILHIVRFASSFKYEMPEPNRKSFYLANATFHDNVNWYYYNALEASFDKLAETLKQATPTISDEKAFTCILNKINILDPCSYVLQVDVPLVRDNEKLEMVKGFCVKHGIHYQTHLGGLRFSRDLEKSHLRALAALASYKHACVDVPFAGAHTGLKINPDDYTPNEMKRLLSSFISIITDKKFFGPSVHIFEPELNCNYDIITWIIEEYGKIKKNSHEQIPACITGKPFHMNGLSNFDIAVANGVFCVIDNFLKDEKLMTKLELEKGWTDKTYIIMGLGKVGNHLVTTLTNEGCKCVGVCEVDVSYYDKKGINIQEAVQHKAKHGTLTNYFPCYNAKKILFEECDMLILAASHKTLSCYTAPNIRTKIIVEAANGSLTPTAHKILLAKNILVIPDTFVNSGSSVASYIEYSNNTEYAESFMSKYVMPYFGTKLVSDGRYSHDVKALINQDIVSSVMQTRVGNAAKKIIEILEEYNLGLDVRTATYIMAIQKIFQLLRSTENF